eukprot:3344059-Rhodomonas_salina.2
MHVLSQSGIGHRKAAIDILTPPFLYLGHPRPGYLASSEVKPYDETALVCDYEYPIYHFEQNATGAGT